MIVDGVDQVGGNAMGNGGLQDEREKKKAI